MAERTARVFKYAAASLIMVAGQPHMIMTRLQAEGDSKSLGFIPGHLHLFVQFKSVDLQIPSCFIIYI